MRVLQLTAENVKRLRAVDITPDSDVVVVSGRNAQGKSSVLDAIWLALGGGAASKGTSRPVRDGQTKARVRLDLGDLIVERRWTEGGGTVLEVGPKVIGDGAIGDVPPAMRYQRPQEVLDSLVGRLTFDPLSFARQAPREQRDTLLSVVELPFDPDDLAAARKRAFDERTEANRDAKELAAQVEGLPEPGPETPAEEVSSADLMAELENAITLNGARLRAENDVDRARREHQEALDAAEEAKRLVGARADALKSAEKTLKNAPAAADVEAIRERVNAVDATNAAVRDARRRAELVGLRDQARGQAERLTELIEDADRVKSEGLAGAAMPLEGLSFDEEGVLYQGVPFQQASASEQLRVGVAIAMAVNPKVRVIRITDGSLLDSESMAMLTALAAERDFQVWVEVVDESGKVGVVIEDGAVVEADGDDG